MDLPLSTHIEVRASENWRDTTRDPDSAVRAILSNYVGEVAQIVNGSRQRAAMGMVVINMERDYPGLTIRYAKQGVSEWLLLTVFPENVIPQPGGGERDYGDVFKIDIPFDGYPIPGMGSGGGSAYPTEYQWWGPEYPFDPAFTPNDPGKTSKTKTITVNGAQVTVLVADAPKPEPDLDGTSDRDTPIIKAITKMIGPVYGDWSSDPDANGRQKIFYNDPNAIYGYDTAFHCEKTGGAAILTTPLSGMQYIELQIETFPKGNVPGGYTLNIDQNYVGEIDGNGVTRINEFVIRNPGWYLGDAKTDFFNGGKVGIRFPFTTTTGRTLNVSWPSEIERFGTPSFGVVPAYYLPEDLQNAAPTDRPGHYLDFTRVPGLDKMLTDQTKASPPLVPARSIYAICTEVKYGTNSGVAKAQDSIWELSRPSGDYDQEAYFQDLQAWAGSSVGPMPSPAGRHGWTPICAAYKAPDPGIIADSNAPTTGRWYEGAMSVGDGYLARCVMAGNVMYPYHLNGSSYSGATTDPPIPLGFVGPMEGPPDGVGTKPSNAGWSFNFDSDPGMPKSSWPTTGSDGQTLYWPEYAAEDRNSVLGGSGNQGSSQGQWPTSPKSGWWGFKHDGDTDTQDLQANPAKDTLADFFGGDVNLYRDDTDHGPYKWRCLKAPTYIDKSGGYPLGRGQPGRCDVVGTFFQGQERALDAGSKGSGAALFPDAEPALQQLMDEGNHCPVYIGRLDLLSRQPYEWGLPDDQFDTPPKPLFGDGADLDVRSADDEEAGMFSGVDLGDVQDGDTLMMAVDAVNGYVWFGRNGKWYIPDPQGKGAICTTVDADQQNPSDGPAAQTPTGWAAVMDGYKKSKSYDENSQHGPPKYFPAVGYRIGNFKAALVYDPGKLKYKPPAGFEVYGQTTVATGP